MPRGSVSANVPWVGHLYVFAPAVGWHGQPDHMKLLSQLLIVFENIRIGDARPCPFK